MKAKLPIASLLKEHCVFLHDNNINMIKERAVPSLGYIPLHVTVELGLLFLSFFLFGDGREVLT